MPRTVPSIVLLLILLIAFTLPTGFSQTTESYSENIIIYLVGNTALIRFNFTGTELGFKDIGNLEASFPDISYYKVYVAGFKSWPSEYLYYSELGYDIFLSKYISSNAAFLYVRAGSPNSAQQFASRLGNFTGLSFAPYGTLDGMYVFFSPSRFEEVFDQYLSAAYPQSYGGFSTLLDPRELPLETCPQFTIVGIRSGDRFIRTVIVDILRSQAVSGYTLEIGKTLFPTTKVKTSNQSNLGSFRLVTRGQIIVASDSGKIKRDLYRRSSELTIEVPNRGELSFPNVTISSGMPSIIAIREASLAALNINDEVEFQLKIRNVGTSAATDIAYNDDWWSKDDKFTLTSGSSSGKIDSLMPGENHTIVYRLKLISNVIQDYLVPQTEVAYTWKVGDDKIQLSSVTNDLYLMLNQNKPSVYLTAQVSEPSTNFGTPTKVVVRAINKGRYSASNLNFAGQIVNVLPPGESWQTTVQAPMEHLSVPTSEKYWTCSWSDGTQTRSSRSNNVTLINLYDTMKIPLVNLTKDVQKTSAGERTFLNVSLVAQNVGEVDAYSITIKDSTIPGLKYLNGTLIEKEGTLTASVDELKSGKRMTFTYMLEVLNFSRNYLLPPASAHYSFQETTFTSTSTTDGIPIGFTIELVLREHEAFDRYNTTGYYLVKNSGDQDIYRLQTSLHVDQKLNITSSNSTLKKATLKTGSEEKVDFNLRFNGIGSNNRIYATANFFFAGQSMNLSSPTVYATSYPYPKITLTAKDEAIEGQPFKIDIVVENQANVTIGDINFKITIPSQLRLVEGNNTVQIQSLRGGEQQKATLKLTSDSPREYKIETGKISFNYKGQTFTLAPISLSLTIADNLTIRYLIPLAVALAMMIAAAFIIGKVGKR
ncbi:MAG: hypothetical protein ACUVQ8_01885 [Nitrososphaeria archaeon]